jgi:hypothetical protein
MSMDELPAVKFTVITTTPMQALADRLRATAALDMTWAPRHMSCVYMWHGVEDGPGPSRAA